MMNIDAIARQLGILDRVVISKGQELMRLSSCKLPSSMGQGEVCRAAVCLELACSIENPGKQLTRQHFVRAGCTTLKVYQSTYNLLQKALDVKPKADLQDVLLLFGCYSIKQEVQRTLQLYKERFTSQLAGTGMADFGRPVFLAAAFYLVAQKHKVKVDQRGLKQKLGVTNADFANTVSSMEQLCADELAPPVKPTRKRTAAAAASSGQGSHAQSKKSTSSKKRKQQATGHDDGNDQYHHGEGCDSAAEEDTDVSWGEQHRRLRSCHSAMEEDAWEKVTGDE